MNLLQLGLDVSSFDAQKEATLNKFIAIFDKLSMYDGKNIKPINISGLSKMNKSISETNKILLELNSRFDALSKLNPFQSQAVSAQKLQSTLSTTAKQMVAVSNGSSSAAKSNTLNSKQTKELESDYRLLTAALKENAAAYQNAYLRFGKGSAEAKAALSDYNSVQKVVGDINKQLDNTGHFAGSSSRALKDLWSQLRVIAYILPGIGIAGIFNLAFEAIGGVIEQLGIFNNEQDIAAKKAQVYYDAFSKIYSLQKDYFELISSNNGIENTIFKIGYEKLVGKGQSKQNELYDKILMFGKASVEAKDELNKFGERYKDAFTDDEGSFIEKLKNRISKLNSEIISDTRKLGIGFFKNGIFSERNASDNRSKTLVEEQLKAKQLEYTTLNKMLEDYNAIHQKLVDNNLEYERAKNELDVLQKEELRKKDLKNEENAAKEKIDINESVLKLEQSTLKKRIDAINKIHEANVSAEKAKAKYQTSKPDAFVTEMAERSKAIFGQKNEYQDWTLQGLIEHGSVPTAETYSVLRDVSDAISKSKRDRDAEINKVTEEFRQRMLDAQLKIDKEELNEQAVKNERVFKNDKNSLDERLKALDEYYVKKKSIEDKEFKRDVDRLKFLYKNDDKTFKKEYDALEQNRASQRMNIQADAEKQVFDIVYSSLHNDFERIKKLNRDQIGEQQENYIKDLKSLNAQLDSKKISLRKYAIERRRIDEEYRVKKLDDDIKDDENDLKRLYDHKKNVEDLQDESNKMLGGALSIALGGKYADKGSKEENKKEIDQARGEADALVKINDEVSAEIETREQKNRDNREQREKRHYDNLKDYAQQYVDEMLNIIDAMYIFFKSISDRELENEIALLQRRFKVMEEGYKMEESAIERSNLANKEKVILETQLQAQQMVAQKNEQAQEKALKRQKAESDKKYSIFKMTIDTAEAVMAALKILPPAGEIIAAERAAAGAIRIATVIATPLPEFAEGVRNFEGGYARTGENGAEIIEEPFKKPYIVLKDNISYLPKGTNVVPIDDDIAEPSIGDNFEQIKWLASRLVKSKPIVNNNIKNTIVIDMGFETYKKQILG